MLYVHDENFEHRKNDWNTGIDFAKMVSLVKNEPVPETGGSLLAWDPDKQKAVWAVEHPGVINGGVLSTAGNLVFQGTGSGFFAAYKADTGEKLWERNTHIGTMAPPVTYTVDGEQYIAVLAGWGGVAIVGRDFDTAATTTHLNRPHMLAFKLNGKAEMPKIEERRYTMIPPPPEDSAPQTVIERGEALFQHKCSVCHGTMAIESGVLADLRYSSKAVHQAFNKIVLEGILLKAGMPNFSKDLDEEGSNAIHSYIISRAAQDRALMLKAAKGQ
jgi:quinohemoprotein ethanol dehydrogenase